MLKTVVEDWTTALAIVAHPDDLEFGAASAIARWTAQGKTVIYCMVTSGEAGIDAMEPAKVGPLREAEQITAAHLVGVDQVDFLREPDGILEYGLDLRAKLARVIRTHRPDVVLTGNFRERFGNGTLNQADHISPSEKPFSMPHATPATAGCSQTNSMTTWNLGAASRTYSSPDHPTPRTGSTPPQTLTTPSPPSKHTTSTSKGSDGISTPGSSSKASAASTAKPLVRAMAQRLRSWRSALVGSKPVLDTVG